MIIEYQVKNYLSFKDLTTFSMVGMKSFKEHESDNVIQLDSKMKVLKSASIYGNNGSGKSNFVKSIGFMKGLVLNSFRDALLGENDKKIPLKKFRLSKECETSPTYFELSFIIGKIIYRYGFELEEDTVRKEWLFHTTTKEVPLFVRENGKITVNKSSFKEGLGLEKVKDNVLFLTRIAHDEGEISNGIINFFKQINAINGINDGSYKAYTLKKLKEENDFRIWVSRFIAFLEISNLSINEEEDIDIMTWHRKYDKNNFLIDTIPFNLEEDESEGTKKLIYLLGPWYDTLKGGKILVVDELDSRLHTNLIKYLIQFFHESNHSNAQLIFVTHNTDMLSKDYLRRDQIWFIDKNQFGASEMYSLGDFKSEQVRNKSAFDKNYIQGKYGAVPIFDNTSKLMDFKKEKYLK